MTVTSNDIANQALQMIGGNAPSVSGQAPTWDNSPAGLALQKLYGPCIATVLRQFGYDFARAVVALSLSGNAAPLGYSYEYNYPTVRGYRAPQVLQVLPQSPDPNNPLPVEWTVGNTLVNNAQVVVIWTNIQNAGAAYCNSPAESTWDPLFREATVRLLASELANALPGRPDTAQALQEGAVAFQQISEGRDS